MVNNVGEKWLIMLGGKKKRKKERKKSKQIIFNSVIFKKKVIWFLKLTNLTFNAYLLLFMTFRLIILEYNRKIS